MSSTTTKSAFWRGFWAGLPFLLVGGPFAMFFGIVATEAGLDIRQTLGMSMVVIAGASQFTAIQLMIDNASIWAVLAASLAVNLRMAMYSASLQPHLGEAPLWQRMLVGYVNFDVSYALGMLEYERRPKQPRQEKVAFFLGTSTLILPMWIGGTYLGAIAGEALPDHLSVDFMMPILFLSLVGPMLRTLAHLGAAVTSVVAAGALAGLPSGTGLLIAGALAMIVGAEIERRRGR